MAVADKARDPGDGMAARVVDVGVEVGLEVEEVEAAVEAAVEGAGMWSARQRQWLEVEVRWKKWGEEGLLAGNLPTAWRKLCKSEAK